MIINVPRQTSKAAVASILRQCAHLASSVTVRRLTAANVIVIGGTPDGAGRAYDVAKAVVDVDLMPPTRVTFRADGRGKTPITIEYLTSGRKNFISSSGRTVAEDVHPDDAAQIISRMRADGYQAES